MRFLPCRREVEIVSAVFPSLVFSSMELVQLVSPMVTPQPIKLPVSAPVGEEAEVPPIPLSSEFTFTLDRHSLVVDAYAPGVFRIRFGSASTTPLVTDADAVGEAYVIEVPGGWRIIQGLDGFEVLRAPLRFRLLRLEADALDGAGRETAAFTITAADPETDADQPFQWQLSLGQPMPGGVYGLGRPGERLGHRHAVFDTHASAEFPADLTEPARPMAPFCWSPQGWGLFTNTLQRTVFAIDHPQWQPDAIIVNVADAAFDGFLFAGNPGDILNQYVHLTGRGTPAPLWSLGVWLGAGEVPVVDDDAQGDTEPSSIEAGGGGTAAAEPTTLATVEHAPFGIERMVAAARRLRERGLGFDGVFLSPGPGFALPTKQGFEWQGSGGSVRRGLSNLKALNARVCVDDWPVMRASSPAYEEFTARNWVWTETAAQVDVPPSLPSYPEDEAPEPAQLLNLLQDDALQYWRDKHKPLLDEGVDVFRLPADAAAGIAKACAAHAPNATQALIDTERYLQRYFQALQTVQQTQRSAADVLIWADRPSVFSHRQPLLQGPTVTADWSGMREALISALNAGALGVPGQAWDIGTLASGPAAAELSPELFLRWLALSTFAPFVRLPVGPDSPIWRLDEAQSATAQLWLNLRYRLLPYLLGAAEDSARMGAPILRSMALAFPDDSEAHAYPLQFLCGPALLVAPVTEPGGEVTVYFPKGEAWWELSTGNRYEGGETYHYTNTLDQLPVFGRDGHMLCLGPTTRHTAEFNSARLLDEVWLFGMPMHHPCVMRNKIRVMQMQGSSYAKGLEGLKILPAEGLEIKRRGAEVRISRIR